MRARALLVAVATAVVLATGPVMPAGAAGGGAEPPAQDWSFSGVFGTYDRAELQRGFQVYTEVCAACHSLDYIAFRNLTDLGFSETEVKAIAAEYEVPAAPDENGDVLPRPATPADRFPAPFENANAARASNSGAFPPDLSLIVEARGGGADYINAVLVGYADPPSDTDLADGMSYNSYFPGGQIAMPPPLFEDGVTYGDGTAATVAQQAHDVTAFLAWASEPNMEERKRMGVMTMIFLVVMTGLLYVSKRKIWSDVH